VLALVVVLVALALANTRRVELDWLVGSTRASLIWIILATAIVFESEAASVTVMAACNVSSPALRDRSCCGVAVHAGWPGPGGKAVTCGPAPLSTT